MEIKKIELSIDDAKAIADGFRSQIITEDDHKLERGVEFEYSLDDCILFILNINFFTESDTDDDTNHTVITKRCVYCSLKAYNTSGSVVEFDLPSDGSIRFDIEEKIKEYFQI